MGSFEDEYSNDGPNLTPAFETHQNDQPKVAKRMESSSGRGVEGLPEVCYDDEVMAGWSLTLCVTAADFHSSEYSRLSALVPGSCN